MKWDYTLKMNGKDKKFPVKMEFGIVHLIKIIFIILVNKYNEKC